MDYSKINLDKRMRSRDSLSSRQKQIDPLEFENIYDVQSNRLNASKVNLGEFIKQSDGGTVLGTFSASQALNLTSSITYNTPKADNRTFGKPIIGIYQGAGTLAANQIYPVTGGSVTLGRYEISGGVINYNTYNGTSDQWSAVIIDSNGTSNQAITFAANWIFTDYVTDTVS